MYCTNIIQQVIIRHLDLDMFTSAPVLRLWASGSYVLLLPVPIASCTSPCYQYLPQGIPPFTRHPE